MTNQKYGLSHAVILAIRSIFCRYAEIQKVILYGSRAKGNFRPGSDIDLTLVAPTMSLSQLLKIENEIEDLCLPYKIDLSLLHQIENSDLIEHIRRVGVEF